MGYYGWVLGVSSRCRLWTRLFCELVGVDSRCVWFCVLKM